jgi:hypothetical protein
MADGMKSRQTLGYSSLRIHPALTEGMMMWQNGVARHILELSICRVWANEEIQSANTFFQVQKISFVLSPSREFFLFFLLQDILR